MRIPLTGTCLTAVLFILVSCGPVGAVDQAIEDTVESPIFTPEATAAALVAPPMEFLGTVDERMSDLLDYYGVPGASLALVHQGEVVWVKGYGLADRVQEIPMEPNTVFPVTSISTAVSAWGALTLAEDGTLDLDAPVEDYLTRWQLESGTYDTAKVTTRRILSHTAGLSVLGYSGYPDPDTIPALEDLLAGSAEGVDRVELIEVPGATWRYSAGGYSVLELLLEELSGESFSAYMQQQVLQPLGMADSSFELTAAQQEKLAAGFDAAQQVVAPVYYPATAASGLYSTAGDLARFLTAAMEGVEGRPVGAGVLSPESVSEMLRPAVNTWSAFQYGEQGKAGMGYALYNLRNGITLVLQFGGGQGFRSMAVMAPELGEGLVVLSNSDRGEEFSMRLLCAWSAWATDNVPEMCTSIQ
ncbi:MAG: beta-lactamase family protein [Anaerolineales bacterium]|nr:beta-lactamase family protein [Anaerolineales bacterium]